MNIIDVYKNLYNMYLNREHNFITKENNRYQISTTARHCGIFDTVLSGNVVTVLDASSRDGRILAGPAQHQILLNERPHPSPISVWISYSTECQTVQLTPPLTKYRDPTKPEPEPILWNISDINEEFIFQQSTIMEVPPYSVLEQFLKYFPVLSELAEKDETVIMLNSVLNWDNFDISEDDFK